MLETIKAVLVKVSGWNCPNCKSDRIGAVKNGFKVAGDSTDLMICFDCEKYYIVYADWFLKRQLKKRAEYPKDIDVDISDNLVAEKERMLSSSGRRLAREFGEMVLDDLKGGPKHFSDLVAAHPEISQRADKFQGLMNALYYADEYFPGEGIRTAVDGAKFKITTGDGVVLSGDDIVIILARGSGAVVRASIYATQEDMYESDKG